jgi:DNA polymerase-3 subunit epsilon
MHTYRTFLPRTASSRSALRLERPLVFVDLETTGADPQTDRIVQIALLRIWPRGETWDPSAFAWLVNPGIPIKPGATNVHGITDEQVRDLPSFQERADDIADVLRGADLAGYNIEQFDLPILDRAFRGAGWPGIPGPEDRAIIDQFRIELQYRPRKLEIVYEEICGEPMDGAHDAMNDVRACDNLLIAQLERYGIAGTPHEIERLLMGEFLDTGRRFKYDEDGFLCLCIGKKARNGPVRILDLERDDPGYLGWMFQNYDPEGGAILLAHKRTGWRRPRTSPETNGNRGRSDDRPDPRISGPLP